MTIWTALEPASTTVDPGSRTTVRLRLRNTGDVVDEYRFETVGDVAPYVTVEPPSIRLFPGTTGVVELTFAPPRTPDSAAGPHPFGVRVMPTEHPDSTTVTEGNVTFTPFMEVRAELVPHTVKGRFKGRPRLAVDNLGNTKLTASIAGDNSSDLSYEIVPSNVQIEPGRAAFVETTLKPRQIIWAGQKQQRPYELGVRRSGTEPLAVEGTYVQRSVMPYWLMTALSLILALTIAGVVLWFAYKPSVRSMAKEKAQQQVAEVLPDEPAPTLPQADPSKDTAAEEQQQTGGDEDKEEEKGEEESGGSEEEAAGGPLPITSDHKPNLFVQFAQVRLAKGAAGCKLTGDYTVGKLDPTTEEALKCFQKASDKAHGEFSRLEKTDGLGNLGRTTMTALLSAHFAGKKSLPLEEGKPDPEVPWVRNIMLWANNVEFDDGDLRTTVAMTRANIAYLRGGAPPLEQEPTKNLASWIKSYQSLFKTEQTGTVNELTLNQWKAGWVKTQDQPGTVTAEGWLPAPME
ncbi:hypothetical protein [Streptomyces sp. NPDC059142]|uniref:COG1470 family protein n=1 Tax=Streptomyces sp. NPDC059142 TaxID=3346739 RepID=UPI00367ADA84